MQQTVIQKTLILRDPFTLLVFALALAGDQLSKALVRGALSIGESLPAEGFLRLTHVTNSGAIFGLFPNQAIVMTAASVWWASRCCSTSTTPTPAATGGCG